MSDAKPIRKTFPDGTTTSHHGNHIQVYRPANRRRATVSFFRPNTPHWAALAVCEAVDYAWPRGSTEGGDEYAFGYLTPEDQAAMDLPQDANIIVVTFHRDEYITAATYANENEVQGIKLPAAFVLSGAARDSLFCRRCGWRYWRYGNPRYRFQGSQLIPLLDGDTHGEQVKGDLPSAIPECVHCHRSFPTITSGGPSTEVTAAPTL